MNSLPKVALCQVWMKMVQWFWRIRFLRVFHLFSLFRNNLPFEKGVALHLDKLESHLPRDTLCQFWLKLAQWFLSKRFLKIVYLYLLLPNDLPLGKGVALHLNKLESPHLAILCAKFGWIWPSGSEEEDEMWKVNRRTGRRTDRQVIGKAYLNFQLRWATNLLWHSTLPIPISNSNFFIA